MTFLSSSHNSEVGADEIKTTGMRYFIHQSSLAVEEIERPPPVNRQSQSPSQPSQPSKSTTEATQSVTVVVQSFFFGGTSSKFSRIGAINYGLRLIDVIGEPINHVIALFMLRVTELVASFYKGDTTGLNSQGVMDISSSMSVLDVNASWSFPTVDEMSEESPTRAGDGLQLGNQGQCTWERH